MVQQNSHNASDKADAFSELLRNNVGMAKFAAIFLLLLWLLTSLSDYFFMGSSWFEGYINISVSCIKSLLQLGGEQIQLGRLTDGSLGKISSHDGAVVEFDQATNGLTIMAVLAAAIAAWPSSLLKKVVAVVSGLAFVFILNIARVAAMLKVNVYWPLQMGLMNNWVLPGLMVLGALGFFLLWMKISGRHPFDNN